MLSGKIFKVFLLWIVLLLSPCINLPAKANDNCPISIPTSPGNVVRNTCVSSTIAWDESGSADTIIRNSNCPVAITDELGKGGPYAWSVSGNGFSLVNPKTKTTSNTLLSNGTACGTATITVTDCGGKTTTGYVRCTTGKWVLIYSCGAGVSNCSWYGSIRGKYKYDASWCFRGYPWFSPCSPTGSTCAGTPVCNTPLWRDCYYGTCFCNWARTWEWGCQ